MIDRWHPAPQSMIDAALVERFSKAKPAPEIVGFLAVFARLGYGVTMDGAKACRMGRMVTLAGSKNDRHRQRMESSVGRFRPLQTKSKRPPIPNNGKHLQHRSGHFPATFRHKTAIARGDIQNNTEQYRNNN